MRGLVGGAFFVFATVASQATAADGPPGAIRRERLDNGMRIVLAPSSRGGGVAVAAAYGLGERHEERGAVGGAWVLAASGSAGMPGRRAETLLMSRAGALSRFVSADVTTFVSELPPGEL